MKNKSDFSNATLCTCLEIDHEVHQNLKLNCVALYDTMTILVSK